MLRIRITGEEEGKAFPSTPSNAVFIALPDIAI
jgi:hypothetical protein